MARELIDILVDLAVIVYALSARSFGDSWRAGDIVTELKSMQSVQTANVVISPTGQDTSFLRYIIEKERNKQNEDQD